jgi:hypothetical protein
VNLQSCLSCVVAAPSTTSTSVTGNLLSTFTFVQFFSNSFLLLLVFLFFGRLMNFSVQPFVVLVTVGTFTSMRMF